MDFSDSANLPQRRLAGPSRRAQVRPSSTAASAKPYSRPTTANSTTSASASRAPLPEDASASSKTATAAPSSGGLFSSLGKAITRPLAWLSMGAAKSDLASQSLPQRRAASFKSQAPAPTIEPSRRDDIESHAANTGSQPPPPPPRAIRSGPPPTSLGHRAAHNKLTPAARSARSPSPAHSVAASSVVGNPYAPRYAASPAPHHRRASSLRRPESVSALSASQSSPAFAFSYGGERRIAGLSSSLASPAAAASPGPSSHYSPSGLAASVSHYHLPSQSPLARRAPRSSLGAASEAGGARWPLGRSPLAAGGAGLTTGFFASSASRAGTPSAFESQYAGSVAGSATSGRTPKRRDWSSLNIAPQRGRRSDGEELMAEYATLQRRAATPNSTRFGTPGARATPGPSTAAPLTPSRLGKRSAGSAMDVDDSAASATGSARKRQMVFHQELGFVSRDELKSLNPSPRPPQNEAERMLNVLERMRTPLGDARKAGVTQTRSMASIPVPLPVPERSDVEALARNRQRQQHGGTPKLVAPETRARARQRESVTPSEGHGTPGMRERLRRPAVADSQYARASRQEQRDEQRSDVRSTSAMSDGDDDESETEEEEEPAPAPTKKAKASAKAAAPVRGDFPTHVLRSGRAVPQSMPKKPFVAPSQATNASTVAAPPAQTSAPAPAPSADAAAKKSTFQVGGALSNNGRSSLRQGAEKQSRSHAKSGRISAWDMDQDDEDDANSDMPVGGELKKISLPPMVLPTGFSFGGGSAAASASSAPKAPAVTPAAPIGEPKKQEAKPAPAAQPAAMPAFSFEAKKDTPASSTEPPASTSSGGSLLGRLGGFASTPAAETGQSTTPSATGFSFNKPASAAPSASASDFFAKPPAVPTASDAKKDGKPPNFFASSLSKAGDSAPAPVNGTAAAPSKPNAAPSGGIPNFFASSINKSAETATPASSAPTTGFSFGKPAATESKQTAAPASTPAPFSFGSTAPAPKKRAAGDEEGSSAGAASEAKKSNTTPATNGFSFGAPSNSSTAATTTTAPSAGFSFKPAGETSSGGPSASAKPASSMPTFSFGTPAKAPETSTTTTATAPAPTGMFSGFGNAASAAPATPKPGGSAPSASNEMMDESPSAITSAAAPVFSFGGGGAATSTTTAATPSTSTSFGGFGLSSANGSSTPAPASTPAFSFGSSNASTTPAAAPPSSSAPFMFSAPSAQGSDASSRAQSPFGQPTAAPGSAGGASTPAFTFGAAAAAPQSNASWDVSRGGSPAPFTFGANSAAPGTASPTPLGNATPAQSPSTFTFGASASTPTATSGGFAFGAAPQQQQQQAATTPSASTGGFSFAMPSASAGGGVGTTAGGGFFGSGATGSTTPSAAPSGTFMFGAGVGGPTPGTNGVASGGQPGGMFQFGAGAAAGAGVAAPGTPAGQPQLFNLGTPSPNTGGRQVKGLPNRRARR